MLQQALSDVTAPSWPALPAEFDAAVCRANHADLRALDDTALLEHYAAIGVREGRSVNAVTHRSAFTRLIPAGVRVLEIGPFANPLLRGAQVKYLDVLPTERLRERAVVHGADAANVPHIDFVSPNGDFAAVTEIFDVLLSSHVIEHQPDLVRHLNGAANVLRPGGRYYLAVPDKRYCFDHFIAESSIAEVVAAHVQRRSVHSVESVIEHQALTTHNDSRRHWAGDHGEPAYKTRLARIREASELFQRSAGSYIDVHAWQFTPESFRSVIQALFDLALIRLRVLRVYPTVRDANEFYAVLENAAHETTPLQRDLPEDFDAALYLAANPDVAAAGMDAVTHYLAFGRSERRKLRP